MQCQRCQGYMVVDFFVDVMNVSGEMTFTGWRCLNCEDIVDAVIAHHRHAHMRSGETDTALVRTSPPLSHVIVTNADGY